MRGKVKKFDDKKGYGFIKSREYDKDIFVHFSEIKMDGYKTLSVGDIVDFKFDSRKNKALDVTIVKKAL